MLALKLGKINQSNEGSHRGYPTNTITVCGCHKTSPIIPTYDLSRLTSRRNRRLFVQPLRVSVWRRSSLTANEHKVYEYSGGTMPTWPNRQVWTLRSTKQSIKHQMRHVEAGVNQLITRNCPSNRASIFFCETAVTTSLFEKPLLMFSINFNQLKQNGKNISIEFHEINVLLWLCGSIQRSLAFRLLLCEKTARYRSTFWYHKVMQHAACFSKNIALGL